ncbi:MAG: porin [Betaproteobacteria bacterium]|nr:porin [Betaproteobacteria bacterium]
MTKIKQIALAVSALGLAGSYIGPAQAGEIDDLKAMMKQMQERIAQLEAKQKAAPAAAAPANAVVAGSMPGSIKVPGSDTSLKIYGYAQLDMTKDFKGRNDDINNNDWASAIFVQPFDNSTAGSKKKGQVYLTSKTSRLGVMTSTPSAMGDLTVKLEGDFNAPNGYQGELATNSVIFRLRHAYGQVGNWLIGQTWGNFLDLGSFADTVDFNGPGANPLLRHPQVRYTATLGKGNTLAVSLENPQSLTFSGSDFDKNPDLVGNWTYSTDTGHFSLRAVSHEYSNTVHSKRAYGVGFGGSMAFGKDTLVGQVNTGNGIGRYMLNSLIQGAADVGSEIRLWRATGWHLGYTHVWAPAVRSNFIVSQTHFASDAKLDAFGRGLGSADLVPNKKIDQVFLNTFWGIAKNTELGLEYAYGKRTTFGPEVGTQERVNATVHYNFF